MHTFSFRPRSASPLPEKIGTVLWQLDIDARIAAFAAACEDPVVIASVASAEEGSER